MLLTFPNSPFTTHINQNSIILVFMKAGTGECEKTNLPWGKLVEMAGNCRLSVCGT